MLPYTLAYVIYRLCMLLLFMARKHASQWSTHNGLVNPIMAWLNQGVKVKARGQIINKFNGYLKWYGLGIDLWAAIMALTPIPRTYHFKQSLPYN